MPKIFSVLLAASLLGAVCLPAHAIWELQPQVGSEGKLEGHKQEVFALAFSPDGQYLASGSFDMSTRIWNAQTWKVVHTLAGHSNWIGAVLFSPDSKWLYTAGLDKQVQVWDVKTAKNIKTLASHQKGILSLALSRDGRYLASGSLDGEIHVHDTQTWALTQVFGGNAGGIAALAFSPDGKYIASAGYNDLLVKVWDVQAKKLAFTLAEHTDELYALAFSPDGKYLASAGEDKIIRLWSMANRRVTAELAGHLRPVWTLAFSPDGKELVSGTVGDQTLRFWTVPQGVNTQTIPNIKTKTYALAVHPKGEVLASGHEDKMVRIWKNDHKNTPLTPMLSQRDVIQVAGFTVDDDQQGQSMGNQNGQVNPGELVEVTVQLKNILKTPVKEASFMIKLMDSEVQYQSPANRFVVQEFEGETTKNLTLSLFVPKRFSKAAFNIEVTMSAKDPFWKKIQVVKVPVTQ